MQRFMIHGRRMLVVGALLSLGLFAQVSAGQGISGGVVEFSRNNDGQAVFLLRGTGEGIGRYIAYGELDFVPGRQAGTRVGTGVVVLQDFRCNLLVGRVTSRLNVDGIDFDFSWTDSVTLRSGAVVSNTGRFKNHRPAGIVVVGTVTQNLVIRLIIAILR